MGLLRPIVLLVVGVSVLLVAPLGSFAGPSAEQTRAAAWSARSPTADGVTFTLATPSACTAPARVLGNACVDRSRMVVADKWVVGTASADRNTELYLTSFSWTVPTTIPSAGGSMTLRMTAKGLQGSICPALSVTGGFGSNQLSKCAESGQSLNESLTVKLKPTSSGAGTTASLVVWVLDGPVYTYTYRAGAAAATTGKCRAPLRLPTGLRAERGCRYLVQFTFDVLQVTPNVWVHRAKGSGTFYVRLAANENRACTDKGLVLVAHVHEPLKGSDSGIGFSDSGEICLSLKGRGTKTVTAVIEAQVRISSLGGAELDDCDLDDEGMVTVRAGAPFNYVHFDVCTHREKYWPVGQEHPAKVKVTIDIKPAGIQ